MAARFGAPHLPEALANGRFAANAKGQLSVQPNGHAVSAAKFVTATAAMSSIAVERRIKTTGGAVVVSDSLCDMAAAYNPLVVGVV